MLLFHTQISVRMRPMNKYVGTFGSHVNDELPSFSGGRGSWESDDDADVDDEDSVATALGCLGPLGGLLAPELQRYQKHLKGWHVPMKYPEDWCSNSQRVCRWPKSSCSVLTLSSTSCSFGHL